MLSAEDREVLLTRCVCGHSINDHGSLVPCWLCEDEGGVCALSFESLLAERVGRIVGRSVTAALNEAADAIDAGVLPGHPNGGYKDGFRRAASIIRDLSASI